MSKVDTRVRILMDSYINDRNWPLVGATMKGHKNFMPLKKRVELARLQIAQDLAEDPEMSALVVQEVEELVASGEVTPEIIENSDLAAEVYYSAEKEIEVEIVTEVQPEIISQEVKETEMKVIPEVVLQVENPKKFDFRAAGRDARMKTCYVAEKVGESIGSPTGYMIGRIAHTSFGRGLKTSLVEGIAKGEAVHEKEVKKKSKEVK